MSGSDEARIAEVLQALRTGDIDYHEATSGLFELIYGELHRQAARLMMAERVEHTLQTTALLHEAYIHLMRSKPQEWENRTHFFGVASRAMRQVLVDHARKKLAQKRGGDWTRITLDDNVGLASGRGLEILELDSALSSFAEKHKRMAFVAELHLFGGLSMRDIATVLRMSLRTAQDDWRVAKMWLNRELSSHDSP